MFLFSHIIIMINSIINEYVFIIQISNQLLALNYLGLDSKPDGQTQMLKHLPPHSRSKFRFGVAPLKIETARYTRTPEEERLYALCVIFMKLNQKNIV